MISRQWRGLARAEFAEAYVEHLRSKTSLEAIRGFAGENVETAIVPPQVREMMIEFDLVVRHYEIID